MLSTRDPLHAPARAELRRALGDWFLRGDAHRLRLIATHSAAWPDEDRPVINALAEHARGDVLPDLIDVLQDWTRRPGRGLLAMRLETLILEAYAEEPDPVPTWEAAAYLRTRPLGSPALSNDEISGMSLEEIRAMATGWAEGLPMRVAAKRARRMTAGGRAT